MIYRILNEASQNMELSLTNSDEKVIVDPDVYEELKGIKIYLTSSGYSEFWSRDEQKHYLVHRYIMGNPQYEVDHVNRNRLDCRRENLRLATSSQNMANRGKMKGDYSSDFIGVTWNKNAQKWKARFTVAGQEHHIGYFDDEIEAAKARDRGILNSTQLTVLRSVKFPR